MCFGDGGAGAMARQQRADEVARQARVNAGMASIDSAFSKFDDNYYAGRAQAYGDYALPQLERQATDAHRALIFALSRHSNLDSSAAIDQNRRLNLDENQARIDVANQGENVANQARTDVENTRSGVVSQLNATGDDSAASAAALRDTQRLDMPQGFSPLGNLFANALATAGTISSNPSNGYSGLLPAFMTAGGGAGSSKGSSRIVRAG